MLVFSVSHYAPPGLAVHVEPLVMIDVYMYIYMYMYMHMHMYMYVHVYMYVCMYSASRTSCDD